MRSAQSPPGRLKPPGGGPDADGGADRRIVSLGCRLNRYESGVMARHLEAAGLRCR